MRGVLDSGAVGPLRPQHCVHRKKSRWVSDLWAVTGALNKESTETPFHSHSDYNLL